MEENDKIDINEVERRLKDMRLIPESDYGVMYFAWVSHLKKQIGVFGSLIWDCRRVGENYEYIFKGRYPYHVLFGNREFGESYGVLKNDEVWRYYGYLDKDRALAKFNELLDRYYLYKVVK